MSIKQAQNVNNIYFANYRVAIGMIDVSLEEKQRLYFANYRAAIDIIDTSLE